MEKAEDKERKANEKKMKEEKLEVSDGGKCWRGKLMEVLRSTGERYIQAISNENLIHKYGNSKSVVKAKRNLSQRL